MKRLVLSSLLILLIFSLVVTASETRVKTLGEADMIVKDRYNISIFPSTINLYKDMVIGQVDGNGLYKIGGHYNIGDDKCVIGLYLDQTPINVPYYRPDVNFDGLIDNKIKLFWGRPFGDIDFGLSLGLWGDSYTAEQNDDTVTTNFDFSENYEYKNLGMDFIVGASLMEKKLDVSVKFNMQSWTYTDAEGKDVYTPEGNTSFGFAARYWYNYNDEVDFIPHLMVDMTSKGYEDPSNIVPDDTLGIYSDLLTTTWSDKSVSFDLGIGWNIQPTDDILFLGDFGVKFGSCTEETEWTYEDNPWTTTVNEDTVYDDSSEEWKYSNNYMPYFRVGLEGKVTKWWDVRLGAVKYWTKDKTEYPVDLWFYGQGREETWGGASTSTYLGSGFHFGDHLHVDVWLDPEFVLNGPNFVSGKTYNAPDLAYMASVLFEW